MLRQLSSLICICIILFACAPQTNDNEALKEEVISIHDEVMPLMGHLKHHEKRLNAEISSLKSKNPEENSVEIKHKEKVVGDLNQAYEGMFIWMRQFNSQQGDMSDEEFEAYLLDQKEKVEEVNSQIKNSLARAQELE
jgi:hypothetical protein